ncbi:MAG: AI-2E family transporter [Fusobacteriaceae bacterium]|jgi:predicted PurR-regulated permease PerM|nr:AI-2E family transporter [Fusobacteriaceae bacterium]
MYLKNNKSKIPYLRIILLGILFIIIQSFLQQYDMASEVYKKYIGYLTPLIYALFTAIFLEPIVTKIETKFNQKRWIAVAITVGFTLLFMISFIGVVIPQVITSFKELYDKLPAIQEESGKLIGKIFNFLKEKELTILGQEEFEKTIINFIKQSIIKWRVLGFSVFLNMLWWSVAITKFFIGFFLGVLILLDKKHFINVINNILIILFGKKNSTFISDFINKARLLLLTYLWGRVIVSFCVAGTVLTISLFAGVPYALLSSIMILLGNMIPYVGSIIAGAISIFIVLVSEPSKAIILFVAICIAQILDNWVIGPKIASETIGVRAFWVILSVLIGGSLFGPVGMFFGVPVFGVVKLIYKLLLEKRNK